MVSLMKIYFLFLITNFFNGHIILGFAFIAHLYREEEDTTAPKGGYTLLVRAKDNIMVIISIITATIYRDIVRG